MKPSMSGIGGNAGRRTLTVPPVKVRSGTPNAATFSSQRSSRVHCFTAPETVIIASRGSKLALEQSNQVISQLQACLPATTSFSIKEVKTRGDLSNAPTMKALGAGAFTDEVDAEVASGHASLAVHSLKDSPVVLPPGVALAACLRREDVRDAFISLGGVKCLGDLPAGSRVGTSSTRRKAQILHHYPHLEVVPLRGNVDVRLEKIACGDADATVLALSGLKRLGKADVVSSVIDEAQILPAACQGAIGITCMEGDSDMMSLLSSIGHFPTLLEVMCERALLHGIVGDAKELPSFAVAVGPSLRSSEHRSEHQQPARGMTMLGTVSSCQETCWLVTALGANDSGG
eukprot:gene4458-14609_t